MIKLAFFHNPKINGGANLPVRQNEMELEMSEVMYLAASKMLNNSCDGFPITCRNIKDFNIDMSMAYIPLIGR